MTTGRSVFDDEVVAALLGLVMASRRGAESVRRDGLSPTREPAAPRAPGPDEASEAPAGAADEMALAALGMLSVARQLEALVAALPPAPGDAVPKAEAPQPIQLRELLR